MPAEMLTRWTVRLALALYVVFVAGQLTVAERPAWRRTSRWVWTLACLSFLVHLAAAMHFHHGWSHGAAVRDTAQQTEALFGYRFGEGIFFSYLFALIWSADVTWWWIRPDRYARRDGRFGALIHGYLLFIAFNGAIVFEAGPTRWVGIPAMLILAVLWGRRMTAVKSRHAGRALEAGGPLAGLERADSASPAPSRTSPPPPCSASRSKPSRSDSARSNPACSRPPVRSTDPS